MFIFNFDTLSVLIFVSYNIAEQRNQRCGQFIGKLEKNSKEN